MTPIETVKKNIFSQTISISVHFTSNLIHLYKQDTTPNVMPTGMPQMCSRGMSRRVAPGQDGTSRSAGWGSHDQDWEQLEEIEHIGTLFNSDTPILNKVL